MQEAMDKAEALLKELVKLTATYSSRQEALEGRRGQQNKV